MSNTMKYKGYETVVEFDSDGECFFGKVLGTRDVITFESTTVSGLKREFRKSVDDYLELCKERGLSPDVQPSGEFRFRPGMTLHREISFAAARGGKSINEWLIEAAKQFTLQGGRDSK